MSSGEKGKVRIRIEGAACCHRRPVRLHWATTGQPDFPSAALGLLFKDWEIFFFAPRQAFTYQLASFADQTQQNGSPNQQDGNTFQQSGPQKQQSGQQVLYPSNAGKHGIGPTLLPLVAYFCFICFIALWAHITDKGLPIFHNFLLGFCCCFIGRVLIPFFLFLQRSQWTMHIICGGKIDETDRSYHWQRNHKQTVVIFDQMTSSWEWV